MRGNKSVEERESLRITNQRRLRSGRCYDLKCSGQRLTLTVTPRSSVEDEDDWCIEAQANRLPEAPLVVVQWGPTRLDALRAVGRRWESTVPEHGLAMFDWEAVAELLAEVRAV